MRYILAAIFLAAIVVGALGMPTAFALPAASPHSLSLSGTNPLVQVVRRKHARAHRHRRDDDGIHPLVGSGSY